MLSPVFIFDSKEEWFPCAVETIFEVPGVRIIPTTDAPSYYKGKAFASLTQLGAKGGRINFPPKMKPIKSNPVGYYRTKTGGGLFWHQFWLFYLYNEKNYLIGGVHEGDWEFVQIGCKDAEGEQPILMTCSQHKTGGKREFWRTETNLDGRPSVYVARGSHANYFTPTRDDEDVADGKGLQLTDIEWRPFGPWATWPGLWGNSTGLGRSPESPGHQLVRWNTPHIYHGQGR